MKKSLDKRLFFFVHAIRFYFSQPRLRKYHMGTKADNTISAKDMG